MMTKMKYALSIGTLLVVTAALVMGLAVPALAKGPDTHNSRPTPTLRTVQGKVVGIAGDNLSFTIQNPSGNITVSVNATTKYYVVPVGRLHQAVGNRIAQNERENEDNDRNEGEELHQSGPAGLEELGIPANWKDNLNWLDRFLRRGQFSDIGIDDRVVARIGISDNVARQVLIIKASPIKQVKGTITGVSTNPNLITITPSGGGTPVTLSWNASTRFVLKGLIAVVGNAGQYAAATYNRDTGTALIVNVLPTAPTP